MIYDVAIVGAGVIGSLTARELSRYNLKTVLVEKFNDVAMGTSKANSAIVHAGFDAETGTVKAVTNVEGTALMPDVCKELSVPYKNIGSLVVAFSEQELPMLHELYERGIANGVPELKLIDREELRKMEPHISNNAVGALWAGTAGIVCPYELTIAAAENSVINGVEFVRNFEVTSIDDDGEVFTLKSKDGEIKAKYIINCAGTFSGKLAEMVGDTTIKIVPRKGEYMLMDKTQGYLANTVIFQCPSVMGKGILVTQTVDGNLLIGPSSIDINTGDDVTTNADVLDAVLEAAKRSVPEVNTRNVITSFAGIRAHTAYNDFIIGPSLANARFINAAGIESPGLSASPAIAIKLRKILFEIGCTAEEKSDYKPGRKAPVRFRELNNEQRKALIEKDSRYGRIICRCETVTEGEILDAIHSPVPAIDVDGVKRRTRAGMGRCQGGFCGSKVAKILADELGKDLTDITKFGGKSNLLVGKTK